MDPTSTHEHLLCEHCHPRPTTPRGRAQRVNSLRRWHGIESRVYQEAAVKLAGEIALREARETIRKFSVTLTDDQIAAVATALRGAEAAAP